MEEFTTHTISRGILTTELDNLSGEDVVGFVRDLESLGYESFWIPEGVWSGTYGSGRVLTCQDGANTRLLAIFLHPSSSNNAFASLRSAVSNPSVNQL